MSRTHQLYHDLQQERIRSAALRLELYRVRQDKDALKTQLEAAHAELAALAKPIIPEGQILTMEQFVCTSIREGSDLRLMENIDITPAQYEAMCLRRVEKGWPGDPPQPRPFIRQK